VEHGLGLQDAIDAPRIAWSSFPSFAWEEGLAAETLDGLRRLGHQPAAAPTRIGSVQAVQRGADRERIGGGDSRRQGTVISVPGSAGE
jgi:gamma-glutamyltranspeptidase